MAALPLTAAGNHNDVASKGCRLIYVARQHTGLPLFFRMVAGNVADVSPVTRTVRELKELGINTKFALLEAGNCSHMSTDALTEAGVPSLMRMDSTCKAYKDAVRDHLADLESREYAVPCHGRLAYVMPIAYKVVSKGDHTTRLYLCKDETMRGSAAGAPELGTCAAEPYDGLTDEGVFLLVPTRKMARDELMLLFHTRDHAEKVFDVARRGAKMLPTDVQAEGALRGHLPLSSMATTALKLMSDRLASCKTTLTTESMLSILREHHTTVYDDEVITQESAGKMREAYEAFGLTCPKAIRRDDDA